MASRCSAWMWTRRPAARTGTANSTSSRSNSNAAGIGFPALNAIRRWRITKRRSGPRTSERQRLFCAERAAASYRSRNIWSAARSVLSAGAGSTRAVRSTIICISNELKFVEVVNNPVGLGLGDLGIPFPDHQCRLHAGFSSRVQFGDHI